MRPFERGKTVSGQIQHKRKRRSLLIGVFVKYGAGNETRIWRPTH